MRPCLTNSSEVPISVIFRIDRGVWTEGRLSGPEPEVSMIDAVVIGGLH